jgi:hypothetical protein
LFESINDVTLNKYAAWLYLATQPTLKNGVIALIQDVDLRERLQYFDAICWPTIAKAAHTQGQEGQALYDDRIARDETVADYMQKTQYCGLRAVAHSVVCCIATGHDPCLQNKSFAEYAFEDTERKRKPMFALIPLLADQHIKKNEPQTGDPS